MQEETVVARVPCYLEDTVSQITVAYFWNPAQVVVEGTGFALFLTAAESEVLETALRVARQAIRPKR